MHGDSGSIRYSFLKNDMEKGVLLESPLRRDAICFCVMSKLSSSTKEELLCQSR